MRVERSGAERVFQRIGQEYASNIHAVDVVNSSDAAHFIVWKRDGWLAPTCRRMSPSSIRPSTRTRTASSQASACGFRVIGYNTNLVKKPRTPEELRRPARSEMEAGKMVKAHPGYSGTIMTATYQMSRDLGWEYFEKLAKQRVMQVQSSADPPKKLALGERAVMADGNEYNLFQLKEGNGPVEIGLCHRGLAADRRAERAVQDTRRTRTPRGCSRAFSFSPEAQQLIIDTGGPRSLHPQTQGKAGRTPFKDIKTDEGRRRPRSRSASRGDQGAVSQDSA